MNLVFIGATKFSLRCLEQLLEIINIKIVGVVTAPKTFQISYCPGGVTNVMHVDMETYAIKQKIPVTILAGSMNDSELLQTVGSWKPDAFLVAGWYHMIPRRWRQLAPAYGLHASLLPDYSGGAPLVWAMINGETKTGITLFEMDDGVDSGPIAAQAEEIIRYDDTIATLYGRIEERGLELLRETIPQLERGIIRLRPQDETKRRIMPQRTPEDGLIDWNWGCNRVDRFIRAQTKPYPGAYTTLNGRRLTIWAALTSPRTNPGPLGRVSSIHQGYSIQCRSGSIDLIEVSYEQETYSRTRLIDLLGGGGQILGESPNCLKN